jgi:GxxExxY protein
MFRQMKINDITYEIRGALFEVNKVLGPGFLEKVYENALLIELYNRGLKAQSQVPIKVKYKDKPVGEYVADVLVEGKIIVELKTVESLDKNHEAQLLNYLKATGIHIGLLANFKNPKVEIKRMVLDLPEIMTVNAWSGRPGICLRVSAVNNKRVRCFYDCQE